MRRARSSATRSTARCSWPRSTCEAGLLPALGLALWQAPAARAADASTTVLVLDVSGSMADPAQIPPDFAAAARLKQREDAVGRLVEQAHPGQKVPLCVLAGCLVGLTD